MKHLKLFETLAQYESFKSSSDFVLPNVSHIKEFEGLPIDDPRKDVRYNPHVEQTPLVCYYNGSGLAIKNMSNVKSLVVDGNVITFDPISETQSSVEVTQDSMSLEAGRHGSAVGYGSIIEGENYQQCLIPSTASEVYITVNDIIDEDEVQFLECMGEFSASSVSDAIDMGDLIKIDDYTYRVSDNLLSMKIDNWSDFTFVFATKNPFSVEFDTWGYIVDTTLTYKYISGGVPSKYYFDNDGEHVIEINLIDNSCISEEMFTGCDILTSVTVPDSVISIGESAFFECYSLTSITIPDSVETIGNYAFECCESLTTINIPDSVTSIGNFIFSDCTSLPVIDNVRYADTYLVKAIDSNQTTYTIKEGTKFIGGYAFESCESLSSITIPDSVTSIGYGAFSYCSSLTEITIPDSVTSIGEHAFSDCSSLTSITIGNSVETIGNWAFGSCPSLTSITIPDSVTSIGNNAFEHCHGLTEITIPDSVTSMGTYAFNRCYSLTSVTIGNSVTSIGNFVFSSCKSLTEITIPNSVTSIGNNAFYGCENLTTINIPDSVETIGGSAFAGCSGLTSVTLGSGLTTIGESAFAECESLTTINIPDSVESIGAYAFSYCSGLTSVTLGSGLTTIGESAFDFCNNLTRIVISENNHVYDSRENCNCIIETATDTIIKGRNSSFIPDSVKTIGYGAFASCGGLTTIDIPDSVKTIGDSAFVFCNGLTSVTLGSGLTTIGSSAFSYCSGLTTINIPDSVETIGGSAFAGCSGLTSVTLGSGLTTIGDCAFEGCSNLSEIKIYAQISPTIDVDAFMNIKENGILYYPANADYSSWLNELENYGWTGQMLYIPTTYYDLSISADDVNGRKTNTTIHWICLSDGYSPIDNSPMTGITLSGTAVSAEFPQNTSETETVERTITFEYQGLTASTVITQGVWVNSSYSVDLNGQWRVSTSVANPDSTSYNGVYESTNAGEDYTASIMHIDIVGYTDFNLYVRSDAESDFDYIVVSNLDSVLDYNTTSGDNVKMNTQGNQNSGTAIGDYHLVEFTNIDGGEHRISVMYKKDSSVFDGTDRGYVLIPDKNGNHFNEGIGWISGNNGGDDEDWGDDDDYFEDEM